jgi:hypothetical protein
MQFLFREGASENAHLQMVASWEELDGRSNEISRNIQHA